MLEVMWLEGGLIDAEGVYVSMTSNKSNTTGLSGDWDLFRLLGSMVSWILGDTYVGALGPHENVFPTSVGIPDMPVLWMVTFTVTKPYHGWAGFSIAHATVDGAMPAVDWYHQAPTEYLGGLYQWFILLKDVSDPRDLYRSKNYVRIGHKRIDDHVSADRIRSCL